MPLQGAALTTLLRTGHPAAGFPPLNGNTTSTLPSLSNRSPSSLMHYTKGQLPLSLEPTVPTYQFVTLWHLVLHRDFKLLRSVCTAPSTSRSVATSLSHDGSANHKTAAAIYKVVPSLFIMFPVLGETLVLLAFCFQIASGNHCLAGLPHPQDTQMGPYLLSGLCEGCQVSFYIAAARRQGPGAQCHTSPS